MNDVIKTSLMGNFNVINSSNKAYIFVAFYVWNPTGNIYILVRVKYLLHIIHIIFSDIFFCKQCNIFTFTNINWLFFINFLNLIILWWDISRVTERPIQIKFSSLFLLFINFTQKLYSRTLEIFNVPDFMIRIS